MTKTEREELEAQVAAAEAEASAAMASSNERAETDALRARLARAANTKRDAPFIAKAEEEIGPKGRAIAVATFPLGSVVVKKPTGAVWKRFYSSTNQLAEIKIEKAEELARSCRVYPEEGAFNAILDDCPGASLILAFEIGELATQRASEVQGKA